MSARLRWLRSLAGELRQTAKAFNNDTGIPAGIKSEVHSELWAAADHVASAVAAFQRWEAGALSLPDTHDETGDATP